MLQRCLPMELKNELDIIFYDGPILTICRSNSEYYVFFLTDIRLDIDENPDTMSFVLFRIHNGDRESIVKDLVEMVNEEKLSLDDIFSRLVLDRRVVLKYGVVETQETIEWFDIGANDVYINPDSLNSFLKRFANSFWIGK